MESTTDTRKQGINDAAGTVTQAAAQGKNVAERAADTVKGA